jgi:hypothetical protein
LAGLYIRGVIDTAEKFIGGVVDTGEQFFGGVVDTSDKFSAFWLFLNGINDKKFIRHRHRRTAFRRCRLHGDEL